MRAAFQHDRRRSLGQHERRQHRLQHQCRAARCAHAKRIRAGVDGARLEEQPGRTEFVALNVCSGNVGRGLHGRQVLMEKSRFLAAGPNVLDHHGPTSDQG